MAFTLASSLHLPSLSHLVCVHAASRGKGGTVSREPAEPNPIFLQQAQNRRIRRQVRLAADETDFYGDLFARHEIACQDLSLDRLGELPLTTKDDLRSRPEGFVRRGYSPTLRTMTTGTTGQGTSMLFTTRESQIFTLMSALGILRRGAISDKDIVQVSTSARALLGNERSIGAYRQAGALVLTPFLPFRESSILLPYDTGDMVRTLVEPCTCSPKHHPATSALLGKKRFCVRNANGWFGPRDLLEILESNLAVPLPVRFGLRETVDGFALQVAVREATVRLQQEICGQLQAAGISITSLELAADPNRLEHPFPWRGDLHEASFA